MKGLLLKDFYSLMASKRFLLLYLVIFGVTGIISGNISFAVTMITVLTMSLSISTFNYDEYYHWERYAASAPVSRKDIVTAKYLFVLILAGCGIIISLVLMLSTRLFHDDYNLLEDLVGMAASCLVCLTGISLSLPFFYKLGSEKGRVAFMLLLGIPFVLVLLLSSAAPAGGGSPLPEINWTPVAIGGVILCLAAIAGSYAASVHIYSKKELL